MTDRFHSRIAIMLGLVMAWAWASIIWAAYPAVVRVSVRGMDGITSHGSGAVVARSGGWSWVLTNYHVVQDRVPGDRAVRVETAAEITAGHVAAEDRTWDLAVVQCGDLRVEPLPIRTDRPAIGEQVTLAGYGHGDYREFHGRVKGWAMPTNVDIADWISTDFAIRSGDSGSPMIDSRGAIVAIAWGSRPDGSAGTYGGRIQRFWRSVCRRPGST